MRGEPADARSDLFAFCATLHEALFGVRPFADGPLLQLHAAVQAQRFQAVRGKVPPSLRAIALRGLAFAPADRPASLQQVLDDLGAVERRLRRRPIALAAALVALALLLAGFLAARVLRRDWRPAIARMPPVLEEDVGFPTWSPDGKVVAWTSDVDGSQRLYVAPIAGGRMRAVTPPGLNAIQARWAPDGAALTVIDDHERVYRVPVAGGEPRLLEKGPRGFTDCRGRLALTVRGGPGCVDCARVVERVSGGASARS
jgi:hypothetical protein